MSSPARVSTLAALVRRHDPDRFLTALFAPADRRETLFLLYAFNHELARAREAASNPGIALIRLHWWREVVEGARRQHEVAAPLLDAVEAGRLDRDSLLALIDAREAETGEIANLAAWHSYLEGTAGRLAVTAGLVLGAPAPALRPLGAAYGAAGVLRSVPALARQDRCLLPLDILAEHGLSVEAVIGNPRDASVTTVLRRLAEAGQSLLRAGRALPLPRAAIPAALPAVLAARDLRRPGDEAVRGTTDRLAVIKAALLARI